MLIATPVQKSHGILGTIDQCFPSVDASSSCMFRQIISRQCTWVTKREHGIFIGLMTALKAYHSIPEPKFEWAKCQAQDSSDRQHWFFE